MNTTIDNLRNIALVAHGGAGKTSLAEVMLFKAGEINRIGRVEEGNTAMDYDVEELQRHITISSGFHQFNWKKHKVSLIDTPGDQNFFSNAKTCMPAADGVVVVIDAVNGIEIRTEQVLEFAREYVQPCAVFCNKMDRERADIFRTMSELENYKPKPILAQYPIGKESSFRGIVDLLTGKAYEYSSEGKAIEIEVPDDIKDEVEGERLNFIENVAEADDELLEKYLEGEEPTVDELRKALKAGTVMRTFMPVMCGSATNNIGVELLQDFIVDCMPSPVDRGNIPGTDPDSGDNLLRKPETEEPFSAFVFKTVVDPYAGRLSIFRIASGTLNGEGQFYNSTKDSKERYTQLLSLKGKDQMAIGKAVAGDIVAVAKLKNTQTGDTICSEESKILYVPYKPLPPVISFAIEAKNKGEEDKVFTSLSKLIEEDIALRLTRNQETKEILLSGRGLVHIEATLDKLTRKFNVEATYRTPKVPYKETIKKSVRVQGKHKKQTGGHGQYGDCWIRIEPLPRGKGFEFVDEIVGGSIPKTYIPAVEKGVKEACSKGVLAGFPCIDFKVTVDDGSYHSVDSSEMAFKIAGSLAFRKAAEDAKPVLLEPIMKVAVTAPDEYTGDLMGDLNSRRGRVLGMDNEGKNQVINANVPMAEILKYAPDLRSMTAGSGMFTMEFSHYDEVPPDIAPKIIEAAKAEKS